MCFTVYCSIRSTFRVLEIYDFGCTPKTGGVLQNQVKQMTKSVISLWVQLVIRFCSGSNNFFSEKSAKLEVKVPFLIFPPGFLIRTDYFFLFEL